MFETAELRQRISRAAFDEIAEPLRDELLALQTQLRAADFPVLLLFAGVDGAGKSETVNLLNEWLDPRWIVTHAYEDPSREERERPEFWRYWRDLPAKGQIGLYLSGWYSRAILDRVYRESDQAQFDAKLDQIRTFERTLADDGALILKFWMHLGRADQKRRLKSLEDDPKQSWRVGKSDWRNWKRYDKFIAAAEQAIRRTDDGRSRWTLVEGLDPRFRSLLVLTSLRDALVRHLAEATTRREAAKLLQAEIAKVRAGELRAVHRRRGALEKAAGRDDEVKLATQTILSGLDLSLAIDDADYQRKWRDARDELGLAAHRARTNGLTTVLLFEGWDASGKGGAIRHITASVDARNWQVVPIGAPNDEERAHHYLWRFWRRLPRDGRMLIFDRSWYGRVLVERVESFANPAEWQRAYSEINDFEEQMTRHGILVMKFWLHISQDEQYRRFKQREAVAYKQWKLTDEDWRNRAKWADYQTAVHDMVEKTSTQTAPWTLIEGNDKNFARLKILATVTEQLRQRLARP
jgi:polyphosphate kinase 2 (PPK2 family)